MLVIAALVAACGPASAQQITIEPTAASSPVALPDAALVGADGRVTFIRHGVVEEPMAAVLTSSGATAVSYSPTPTGTRLAWHDLRTGTIVHTADLTGSLTVRAVEPAARVVALTGTPSPGRTEVVVAGVDGELFRQTYDHELLPEGFANAWESTTLPIGMFVIDYLDQVHPDSTTPRTYQVRVISLPDGALQLPLNLRNKGETVDEQMTGLARTQVTSERDGLLFTLYRGVNPDASTYAFVHTLGFINGVWCLDVPNALELQRRAGSLTLAPDGTQLFVGSANGTIAEYVVDAILDPARAPVAARTASIGVTGQVAPSMSATSKHVVAALGARITWLNRTSLLPEAVVNWSGDVEAMAAVDDDSVLVAERELVSLVGSDGRTRSQLTVPSDLGAIVQVVPVD